MLHVVRVGCCCNAVHGGPALRHKFFWRSARGAGKQPAHGRTPERDVAVIKLARLKFELVPAPVNCCQKFHGYAPNFLSNCRTPLRKDMQRITTRLGLRARLGLALAATAAR